MSHRTGGAGLGSVVVADQSLSFSTALGEHHRGNRRNFQRAYCHPTHSKRAESAYRYLVTPDQRGVHNCIEGFIRRLCVCTCFGTRIGLQPRFLIHADMPEASSAVIKIATSTVATISRCEITIRRASRPVAASAPKMAYSHRSSK